MFWLIEFLNDIKCKFSVFPCTLIIHLQHANSCHLNPFTTQHNSAQTPPQPPET